jgi:hypothetical protein
MDNTDHKDKIVDNTPTIQTDVPNDGEPSPPEHTGEPEDIGDPEEFLEGPAGEPQEDPAGEAGELSEEAGQEAGEPQEDPDRETSSDEVRTALVTVRGQNRSAHFNAEESTLSSRVTRLSFRPNRAKLSAQCWNRRSFWDAADVST